MQFQRRQVCQVLDGAVVERDLDLVVMGGTRAPGMSIIDVTDPTAPSVLTTVSCGGFHSDVAVYENYVVQSWDGKPAPCADGEPANPDNLGHAPGEEGIRIYDITDSARPRLVKFYGRADGIPAGVHNVTINGPAGLVYLNMAEFNADDPPWSFVDLNDPELPVTLKSIWDWSPSAGDGCHDSSLSPQRGLYACAGITASCIWDITSGVGRGQRVGTLDGRNISARPYLCHRHLGRP